MARVVALRRSLLSLRSQNATVSSLPTCKSLSDSNILRILRNEASYQSEYAPPRHLPSQFNSFTLQDRPREQWITMSGTFENSEEINLQITMFDGFQRLIKPQNDDHDGTVEDLRLYISFLVNVMKKNDQNVMEFVCSAWPDCLEIQNVYIRDKDKDNRVKPYFGPNFRNLSRAVQRRFKEYLEERGVNDKLCVFLHEYMMNKDRIELIQWFRRVESFVER